MEFRRGLGLRYRIGRRISLRSLLGLWRRCLSMRWVRRGRRRLLKGLVRILVVVNQSHLKPLSWSSLTSGTIRSQTFCFRGKPTRFRPNAILTICYGLNACLEILTICTGPSGKRISIVVTMGTLSSSWTTD